MSAWIIEAFGSYSATRYDVSWAIRIMAIAIASLLGFCSAIVYQTLVDHDPPVTFGEGKVRAWVDLARDATTISYTRPVIIHKNVSGVLILRSIDCTVDGYRQTFDLQPLIRNYTAGNNQNVNRLVVYPYPLQVGTKCSMGTMMRWTPPFSINEHSFSLPKVEFVVDQLPSDVREPR